MKATCLTFIKRQQHHQLIIILFHSNDHIFYWLIYLKEVKGTQKRENITINTSFNLTVTHSLILAAFSSIILASCILICFWNNISSLFSSNVSSLLQKRYIMNRKGIYLKSVSKWILLPSNYQMNKKWERLSRRYNKP